MFLECLSPSADILKGIICDFLFIFFSLFLAGKQYCGNNSLKFTSVGELRKVILKLKSIGINIISIITVVLSHKGLSSKGILL